MLGYKPPLAAHRLQMDLLTIDEHSADHRLTALQRAIARGQHERGLADGFDHQRPRLDLEPRLVVQGSGGAGHFASVQPWQPANLEAQEVRG